MRRAQGISAYVGAGQGGGGVGIASGWSWQRGGKGWRVAEAGGTGGAVVVAMAGPVQHCLQGTPKHGAQGGRPDLPTLVTALPLCTSLHTPTK